MSSFFSMVTLKRSNDYTVRAIESFFKNTEINDDDEFLLIDNDGCDTDNMYWILMLAQSKEICSNNSMKNDKGQTVEKDDEVVASTLKRTQEPSVLTGRPNIDVITARNEEEAKQDRSSSYKTVAIVSLLVAVIIIAIYFFS